MITTAFMLFYIIYLPAITVFLTWGDWNRYRFGIDAFYLILLGLLLTAFFDALKNTFVAMELMRRQFFKNDSGAKKL